MTIVVVDEAEGVVVVFGGETEGVVEMEVTGGDGGGIDNASDSSKGGVVIVCCDAIAGFEVDEFRDVLVPVKGIEEFVVAGVGYHKERARRDGFGRIPNEEINLRVVV